MTAVAFEGFHKYSDSKAMLSDNDKVRQRPVREWLFVIVSALLSAVLVVGLCTVIWHFHSSGQTDQVVIFDVLHDDDSSVQAKVVVSETQQHIYGINFEAVYDFKKGIAVYKLGQGNTETCFITWLNGTIIGPLVDHDKYTKAKNILDAKDASLTSDSIEFVVMEKNVDTSLLSPDSRNMCEDLQVQWASARHYTGDALERAPREVEENRVARAEDAIPRCSIDAYLVCCPWRCVIRITINF